MKNTKTEMLIMMKKLEITMHTGRLTINLVSLFGSESLSSSFYVSIESPD